MNGWEGRKGAVEGSFPRNPDVPWKREPEVENLL